MNTSKETSIADLRAEIRGILEIAETILKIVQSMEISLNEDRVAFLEKRLDLVLHD